MVEGTVELLSSDCNGKLDGDDLCTLRNASDKGLIIGCAQVWQELIGDALIVDELSISLGT